MACDESKLAPIVAEYNTASEKVRDLTDSWVGAIRKGTGRQGGSAAQHKRRKESERKPIKRNRVQLMKLPGALGGAGKGAEEHFGADAQDADEMEYCTWRMESLFNDVKEEAEATRKRVRCRVSTVLLLGTLSYDSATFVGTVFGFQVDHCEHCAAHDLQLLL